MPVSQNIEIERIIWTLLTEEQTNLQPRTMLLSKMVRSPRASGNLLCSLSTCRVMVIKSVLIASAAWSMAASFTVPAPDCSNVDQICSQNNTPNPNKVKKHRIRLQILLATWSNALITNNLTVLSKPTKEANYSPSMSKNQSGDYKRIKRSHIPILVHKTLILEAFMQIQQSHHSISKAQTNSFQHQNKCFSSPKTHKIKYLTPTPLDKSQDG